MTYENDLQLAISAWRQDPIEDEWIFEKFRSDVVGGLSSADAFDAIDLTVDTLLREHDESTAIELLQTLICLARRSETTEMPTSVTGRWAELVGLVSSSGEYAKLKLKELAAHYRMDASLQ